MKNIFYLTFVIILLSFNSKAQSIDKDTLFFKFDRNYILGAKDGSDDFLLADSNSDGTFYFERKETTYNLKSKKVKCLKKFIHNSEFYRKKNHRKLNDFRLYEYFEKYVVFLVNKNEYIHVESRFEIE
ncbi:hypothetical protein EC396_04280 [Lutibacter sp. HS1-25]|uniref:hypothetical protein n=1 Tax=Lutibacter sp. HS1-25 TaxID=2485000 RepID=UPI001013A903|nr:hypothetical protein [Lutibacter sp. HS1-25]RXP60877.1 hypothetical protein EC396_04280 [Lutibacter sp. HS1-25]